MALRQLPISNPATASSRVSYGLAGMAKPAATGCLMPAAEIYLPEHIDVDLLQGLYDAAGLNTRIDSDGDLAVSDGVTCYAIPTRQCDRILLLAFVGTKGEIGHAPKIEFANRVNNQIATVRARVNQQERVMFDYYIPVEGGITGRAIVSATQFFLQATAHAVSQCDEEDIVR